MAGSRASDLSGPMRSGPPWGASRGHPSGGKKASAPELRGRPCRTPRVRRIGPESRSFSALLRPPSGSTPAPLATTLGVAFAGPVSRPPAALLGPLCLLRTPWSAVENRWGTSGLSALFLWTNWGAIATRGPGPVYLWTSVHFFPLLPSPLTADARPST